MATYILAFGIALVVTFIATPFVRRLAFKIGAIDKPDARKVHHGLIPRLGGLAIFIGYIVSIVYRFYDAHGILAHNVFGLVLGSTILVAVGIWDDVKQIDPKTKLMGQIIAAAVLVAYGIRVNFLNIPFLNGPLYLEYWSVPLTIFWIVGFTNIVNLIDGLDGLAAGISLIAAVAIAVVTYSMGQYDLTCITLALAGSALAFLRYNFNPAKIFMGDTGSMLLGYSLAAICVMGAVKTAAVAALVVPVIVLGLPILDTLFAIIRRKISGRPIFKPDKSHVHHRLLAQGLSQKQTVLLMYVITAILASVAVVTAEVNAIVGGILVVIFVCLSVVVARRIGVISRTDAAANPIDRNGRPIINVPSKPNLADFDAFETTRPLRAIKDVDADADNTKSK